MQGPLLVVELLALVPVVAGTIYGVLRVLATLAFVRRRRRPIPDGPWPAVTVLKPVCGMEKGLEDNLRSVCEQDHPDYQVVLSAQRADDPALPLLQKLRREYGSERVTLVVAEGEPAANGKVFNLIHALAAARHDVLVISDSDVRVPRDYLRTIVAPLSDPTVGYSQTIYRGVCAQRWFERLELLSLHDFTSDIVFASMTGASGFCLGSSIAFRRKALEAIGGLEPLAEYLVEDFEMGRRMRERGFRQVLVPYSVDTVIDLADARAWWEHQLYWDQNTRHARPGGFFATILIRPVPFALLFAALRLADPLGLLALAVAVGARLVSAGAIMGLLREREGLRNLALLPVRDVAALAIWILALRRGTVTWRDREYELTRDGRMVPVGFAPGDLPRGPDHAVPESSQHR
jgi:ceramide glucosyltransferase